MRTISSPDTCPIAHPIALTSTRRNARNYAGSWPQRESTISRLLMPTRQAPEDRR